MDYMKKTSYEKGTRMLESTPRNFVESKPRGSLPIMGVTGEAPPKSVSKDRENCHFDQYTKGTQNRLQSGRSGG